MNTYLPPVIDDTMSIDELLLLHPVTARVFNAFGIDTCCGGAATLAEATAQAGVPCDDVRHAVAHAIAHANAKALRQ